MKIHELYEIYLNMIQSQGLEQNLNLENNLKRYDKRLYVKYGDENNFS